MLKKLFRVFWIFFYKSIEQNFEFKTLNSKNKKNIPEHDECSTVLQNLIIIKKNNDEYLQQE